MGLIRRLKDKIEEYAEFRSDELEYRIQYDIEAAWMRHYALTCNDMGVAEGSGLVVSMTTYEQRLQEVYLTIESIMQQTVKPNRIILWLAESMRDNELPVMLKRQMQRGLEVRYCEDLRSYKKLIPTLQLCPNDVIITIDDDVIYSLDLIENLLSAYQKEPDCVHCGWAKEIKISDGVVMDYNEWCSAGTLDASLKYMPIGCAGILYPPHCFDEEVMNQDVFMDICKYGDDIWFKAMELKNGIKCKQLPQNRHRYWYVDSPLWQNKGLVKVNRKENDIAIKEVFDRYNIKL